MTTDTHRAVLTHLAAGGDNRFSHAYLITEVRKTTPCSEGEIWEALWGLVAHGLIYLDTAHQGSGTDNWQWKLSGPGKQAAEGGSWEPQDPDGFLKRLRRDIPDLDALVELYLTEALRSFNAQCYLATSVMLGVAAERAFHVMAQAFAESSMPGAQVMAKELAKPISNYFVQWNLFRKRIEPVRKNFPDGLGDALTLDALADLIRLTRNETGHPTGILIDEDTARVHLTIVPVYLRKMHLLANNFRKMEISFQADSES